MKFKMPVAPFKNMSELFTIIRNNKVIADKVYGFFCSSKYPNSIQTLEFSDIIEGDILVHNKKNYHVIDVKPLGMTDGAILKYETDYQRAHKRSNATNIFNIGTINGNSIIGSQENISISIDQSINSISNLIDNDKNISMEEKEAFRKMLHLLETNLSNDIPMQKGLLSKFSNVLHKHQHIAIAVMQMLFAFVTAQSK